MAEPVSYEFITLIKRLSGRLQQNIDAWLRPYGLARTQYVMLYYLHSQPGISGVELAEKMMIEPATLTSVVDVLQTKGLVERIDRTDDKRRKDIRLTESGEKLLREIPPPGPAMEAVLLDNLSHEQSDAFKNMGYRMLNNLEDELEKQGEGKHVSKD
jgi:DNA-binding MarR family transcriptional regulator